MDITIAKNTDGTLDVSWKVWVNHRWKTEHLTARNSTELANAVSNRTGFFVVSPAVQEGVLSVDNEGMDTWRQQLYSLSEGAIGVGDIVNTDKYKVARRKFVTQSAKTFADIVISALSFFGQTSPAGGLNVRVWSYAVWLPGRDGTCCSVCDCFGFFRFFPDKRLSGSSSSGSSFRLRSFPGSVLPFHPKSGLKYRMGGIKFKKLSFFSLERFLLHLVGPSQNHQILQ